MFCDKTQVHFIAGRGGSGCISFRREKYIPRGGPNGGNGGAGGGIFLRADENINTLAEFNTQKVFRAQSGEHGRGKQQAGSDAPDLILHVPVGTIVFDEKKKTILGDLRRHNEKLLISKGGKGGFGNEHFKSSTRQAPAFAELGEPGEEKKCVLELKLVADVGIIGLPSAGKSTLLSRISNAKPKIADYHFTTLIPNLGLVDMRKFGGAVQQNFLACDLPGLIEGAHKGKGLGIQFLKHVVRNKVLVHLIDITLPDSEKNYEVIRKELKKFDKKLAAKPQITAFNKIDTLMPEQIKKITAAFKKKHKKANQIFAISAVQGTGIKELVWQIWETLERQRKEIPPAPAAELKEYKIFKPALEEDSRRFTVSIEKKGKKKSVFRVTGKRIEQIAVMTDFRNPEAVSRVYDVFEKMGIDRELKRTGAKFGDDVLVGAATVVYR